jgi:hypothetical protein
VIAEVALDLPGWEAIAGPEGARDAREHLYRVAG